MKQPTQRSLIHLRSTGYTAGVVEKWIQQTKQRQDLFGCIDILAIRPDKLGSLGIQCTSQHNVGERVKKACAEPRMRTWLLAGNRLEVWGWAKKKLRWKLTRRVIQLRDLAEVANGSEGERQATERS